MGKLYNSISAKPPMLKYEDEHTNHTFGRVHLTCVFGKCIHAKGIELGKYPRTPPTGSQFDKYPFFQVQKTISVDHPAAHGPIEGSRTA